jgi:hypothetical protein
MCQDEYVFPSPSRITEFAGTASGISGLLLLGLVSGADLSTVTIDALSVHVAFFEGAVSVGVFTAFVLVSGAYVVRGVWREEPAASLGDGPDVCAIVPAYRDAAVVGGCVESLLASDYGSFAVSVVVEPDDPRTRERAEALAASHDDVRCLVNAVPGSKAGAINHAVEASDADYLAVFDADEEVSPGFLPAAMAELLADAEVFQGRRIPRPTGVVETLAYCERIVVQTGYAAGELVGFTHCGSSSTAFTRAAFETVDGYDDKLTEDIDFSHKCHRAGLDVTRRRDVANTMEAPHTLRDLWGQRKRWRIGHVEVLDGQLRETATGGFGADDVRSIGRAADAVGADDVRSIGRAAGAVGAGAFLLVFSTHVLRLTHQGIESAFLVPYAAVLCVVGGVWLRDHLGGRVRRPGPAILLVPLAYVGHGVLTVKALLEYYLTWEGEWYRVSKVGA